MKRLLLIVLLVAACSTDDETPLDTVDSVFVAVPSVVERDSLPELPTPTARPGRIAIQVAGSMELNVTGDFTAIRCEESPASILLEADEPLQADERWGFIAVITPGDSSWTVTAREGGAPDSGTIQVAVQRIIPTSSTRYQAIDGTAAIEVTDSTVGGTLDLVMRAWDGRNLARLAGAIGVSSISAGLPGRCRFDEPAD